MAVYAFTGERLYFRCHNLFVLFLVDVTALGDVALDGPSLATRLVQHLTVFAHESSINHLTVQLLTVLMLMVLL